MPDEQDFKPAQMTITSGGQRSWQRISLVWLVPLAALIISLAIAWQNFQAQGQLITISFKNTSGITANETVIKFRDVTVGKVEKVNFANSLSEVIVTARIDKDVAPYLDEDAKFWVVRPDVSVRGITGLDTVLSGVYIEGSWDANITLPTTEFFGLQTPPLVRAGQEGITIHLRADDGGALTEGAPILHKGIQVGYLEKPELSFDGNSVIVAAFVEAPYDKRITSNTRFWDTSGFSINLDASGLSLNVESLASLIEGGIAFDTVISGGTKLREGTVFDIFFDEQTARSSLFSTPNQELLNLSILFDESVSGLTAGADVRFQGIRIGSVKDLSAFVVSEEADQDVQLRTNIEIEPGRLGLGETATPEMALSFLEVLIEQGLRARMATGNILSGSLQIELITVENAPPETLLVTDYSFPIIPTTTSNISDVSATADGILQRVSDLPIEELMSGAIEMMDSFERLANEGALREAPQSLNALLNDARRLINSEDVQTIPVDVNNVIDSALQVLENMDSAVNDVQVVAATTQDVIKSDISDNLSVLTQDIRSVVADVGKIVADTNDADLVGQITKALASATQTVDNIEAATKQLPAITNQVEALIAKANALEIQALVESANDTIISMNALIGSDDTAALPAAAISALNEMEVVLAEIRAGGAIENVNVALSSASQAAKAIEDAVIDLPALSSRASRLVSQTQAVIESYGDRSRFSAEMSGTLRDIQAAADAVTSLARTIQRNPSSLIRGR